MDSMKVPAKFEVRSFTRFPEKIAIEVLGVRIPNVGEEEVLGGRRWYRSKERW